MTDKKNGMQINGNLLKDGKVIDHRRRGQSLASPAGSLPTKAEVLKAIYESGVHQDNPMMILTLRRNGKIVEEPSAYAMVFARRLAENNEESHAAKKHE